MAAPLVLSGKLSYVSLNASPSQFRTSGLAATVQEVLAETGFPASALVIEITEELVMSNLRTAFRELSQLAKRGVRLALDDFGTGYSNIASLRKLPIDWLKLDRSLLTHVERQPVDQAIVRAVLQMAQGLGVEVIAEGIESKGRRTGCQRPAAAANRATITASLSRSSCFCRCFLGVTRCRADQRPDR